MREPLHTEAVRFRIPPVLLRSAQEQARAEGLTFSELVREALRYRVSHSPYHQRSQEG